MVAHARATYPNECCGAMLGTTDGEKKIVVESIQLRNAFEGAQAARYELRPEDLLAADKAARERSMDLIGIYHSHPDHPSRASQTDTDRAVEIMAYAWSYIIVSVQKGKVASAQSWMLSETDNRFHEESLVTEEGDSK